jgi:hypothetical protein
MQEYAFAFFNLPAHSQHSQENHEGNLKYSWRLELGKKLFQTPVFIC